MEYYITYWYNLRFLTEDFIPVSTCIWDPSYLKLGNGKYFKVNENNVFCGLKEEKLIFNPEVFNNMDEQCQKDCPYKDKVPNCAFMINYGKQLRQIDFKNDLIPEFERVAEEVRKVTHYKGEPKIILMVHEKPDVLCSERPVLRQVFAENGIELKEWTKEQAGVAF